MSSINKCLHSCSSAFLTSFSRLNRRGHPFYDRFEQIAVSSNLTTIVVMRLRNALDD